MKIEVTTPELPLPIILVFPTGFLKSRWLWNLALKYTEPGQKQTVMNYRTVIAESAGALEAYARKNGHFNLVEVAEADGTRVIIRI